MKKNSFDPKIRLEVREERFRDNHWMDITLTLPSSLPIP